MEEILEYEQKGKFSFLSDGGHLKTVHIKRDNASIQITRCVSFIVY